MGGVGSGSFLRKVVVKDYEATGAPIAHNVAFPKYMLHVMHNKFSNYNKFSKYIAYIYRICSIWQTCSKKNAFL